MFGKSKKGGSLGVDIGANSIKLVELSNDRGRAKLMTYGYAELPASNDGGVLLDQPKQAGELLAEVCKKAGCAGTIAMAALPTSNIFSTILSIPATKDKKKIKPMIDAEVAKLSPLPLSEMITYSTFLDGGGEGKKGTEGTKGKKGTEGTEGSETKADDKNLRVLVTGAAKTLVQKYIEIFKIAKLQLQALDTESFALIRSLIGKDKNAIMLIDLGAKRTNMTVVEKGIPFVSRSINIGGDSITSRIGSTLNVPLEQAERMKRDFVSLSTQDSHLAGKLPPFLEPFFQSLVNEAHYAFELYTSMELTEHKKVEKIILTGGSSHLPRMLEFLSETLNMNVYRGDPWARVAHPQDLSVVFEEIGPRMSVAVGLAMRDIE
jgi:type IV pilus assembly protein PilM